MSTSSIHLYVDAQYASPYAMSVFVALTELGLPFRMSTIDLAERAQLAPDYAALSLTARVPTLVHGDFALSESSAITEYLAEVFPGSALYPKDPRDRARARQVQAWLRSDLVPIRKERSTEVIFYHATAGALSDKAVAAAARLYSVAEALLPAGAPQLFGDWSIADVELALMLNRLQIHGDAIPARLADYAREQWSRPSVRAWLDLARPPLVA